YFLLKYTFAYIYPFILALLIAFILNPLITYMQSNCKLDRTHATSLIMFSSFVVFFTTSFFVIKRLIEESSTLVDTLPEQIQHIKIVSANLGQTFFLPIYEKLSDYFPFIPPVDQLSIQDYLETFIDDLGQTSLSILSNFVGTAS